MVQNTIKMISGPCSHGLHLLQWEAVKMVQLLFLYGCKGQNKVAMVERGLCCRDHRYNVIAKAQVKIHSSMCP